jgi:hypothetical protein
VVNLYVISTFCEETPDAVESPRRLKDFNPLPSSASRGPIYGLVFRFR